jgi:hypothetical protein
MTKTFNLTFAAALVAASAFGSSAALAGGDYFQGVSNEPVQNHRVDAFRTDSIGNRAVVVETGTVENVGPARGDYYQGADRNAASAR